MSTPVINRPLGGPGSAFTRVDTLEFKQKSLEKDESEVRGKIAFEEQSHRKSVLGQDPAEEQLANYIHQRAVENRAASEATRTSTVNYTKVNL